MCRCQAIHGLVYLYANILKGECKLILSAFYSTIEPLSPLELQHCLSALVNMFFESYWNV